MSELKEQLLHQSYYELDRNQIKEILSLYEKVEQLEETEKAWKKKSLKLQQQNQRLRDVLSGLLDDFKYYIAEMYEEPTRAGYMKEAEQALKQ